MTVMNLGAALSFELSKIRTLRSTAWNLGLFLVVSVALAITTGYFLRITYTDLSASAQQRFDPIGAGHSGLQLGLLALVILGVLVVTSEFSSGTIRSSLTAVPRRGVFFTSKLLAGALVAFAASVVVVVVSFFATQAALGSHSVGIGDDGVLRSLVGAVLYTTLLTVFAMGLATVLRSAALTIGILIPLFFMVSTILANIPHVQKVAQFLPDIAGGQILYREPQGTTVLNPWTGLAVLVAWTAAAVVGGFLVIRRRDA
ncbi:ABC-2 family transporter [Krasilnikovia cinnamomea]|uniref:ABC-2 family transporter n=1 Tax=Krasilnikovia cinnamomea TaxID=349313 RepID=A0A4Q7ZK96_9ACTN|nr:ABC transporter permease subunit [Krasilnikovia cinnamomea]RZU51337.1 ABC-2 family transporter [Krasilnikovia cinnamomea]